MNDDRLDRLIRDTLREEAPRAPREAIWRDLEARRGRGRTARRGWNVLLPVAAAALLLLGVWIGRWSAPAAPPRGSAPRAMAAREKTGPGPAYERAAAGYLGRTETLLTRFRAGGEGERSLAPQARELLGELRLFMDSPAARDPELNKLFLDLEVILTRIVHADDSTQEHRDISESLEQRAIMMRIQNRVPVGL